MLVVRALWTHHRGGVGEDCVATEPPNVALDQWLAGRPAHPAVLGDAGCLCPGFVQGQIPYAIRKRLDGVGEGPCAGYGHDLSEHAGQ